MISHFNLVFSMIPKEILSAQHPIVKHLVALRSSKAYRNENGTLLVTGSNMFSELEGFRRVFVLQGHSIPFSYHAEETFFVTEEILRKVTGLVNPEPLMAEITKPKPTNLKSFNKILVLDRISDPGNLGTLLRSALALGWEGVFLLEGSVDLFNDKVIRASKGAIFRLPFTCGNEQTLADLINEKPWHLLAANPNGNTLKTLSGPLMLALGNEAKGLSPFIETHFASVALPMPGNMESLNVASAGAIFMYILGGHHGAS